MKNFTTTKNSENLNDWNNEMNSGFPNISVQPINNNVYESFFKNQDEVDKYNLELKHLYENIINDLKCPEKLLGYFMNREDTYIIEYDKETSKSFLRFNYSAFIKCVLSTYLYGNGIYDVKEINDLSNEEKNEVFRAKLRKTRDRRLELIREADSENFLHKEDNPMVIASIASVLKSLKVQVDEIKELLVSSKYFLNFFDQTILTPRKESFDYERLKFYLHSQLLNTCINAKNPVVQIYQVINYYQNQANKDNTDELYYSFFTEESIEKTYSFRDFSIDLQKYLLKNKNISMERLGSDFFKGYSITEIQEYLELMTQNTLSNFDELKSDSHFFLYNLELNKNSNENSDRRTKSNRESLLSLQKRQFYADNNEKIYKYYLGKKKFKGHLAIVMKNGYVIFEKYDNIENNTFTRNGAAYVMNVYNFLDLSSKSLTEIREQIKLQSPNITDWDRI